MSAPTWDDITVTWAEDDDGRDLIVIATHDGKVLAELSPLDALAMAAHLTGQARDALMAVQS